MINNQHSGALTLEKLWTHQLAEWRLGCGHQEAVVVVDVADGAVAAVDVLGEVAPLVLLAVVLVDAAGAW